MWTEYATLSRGFMSACIRGEDTRWGSRHEVSQHAACCWWEVGCENINLSLQIVKVLNSVADCLFRKCWPNQAYTHWNLSLCRSLQHFDAWEKRGRSNPGKKDTRLWFNPPEHCRVLCMPWWGRCVSHHGGPFHILTLCIVILVRVISMSDIWVPAFQVNPFLCALESRQRAL